MADNGNKNPLLDNIDRTVFTFNMHNLGEFCFKEVFGRDNKAMKAAGHYGNKGLSKEH